MTERFPDYEYKQRVWLGEATGRIAELEAEVTRMNGQIAEWIRQNLAIVALEVKERKRAETAERRLAEAIGPEALERALEAWHRPLEWWTRKGSDPLRNHRERMAEAIRAALAQTEGERW